jgi:hypothetical protein
MQFTCRQDRYGENMRFDLSESTFWKPPFALHDSRLLSYRGGGNANSYRMFTAVALILAIREIGPTVEQKPKFTAQFSR